MTNIEKYMNAFKEAFEVNEKRAKQMIYGESEEWDSMGHMLFISKLEEGFGIELEPDEMLKIKSFDEGIEVLSKKGIVFGNVNIIS